MSRSKQILSLVKDELKGAVTDNDRCAAGYSRLYREPRKGSQFINGYSMRFIRTPKQLDIIGLNRKLKEYNAGAERIKATDGHSVTVAVYNR